tara:strand:- start:388 stop:1545 length:1158 start_codon:yes stop_codon:yes gene_type:complete
MNNSLLLTEEQLLLKKTLSEFSQKHIAPHAHLLDQNEQFPAENLQGLASLGVMGTGIDPELGGSSGGYQELAVVVEEIAKVCAGTSTSFIAHVSLTLATIYNFSRPDQREKFVPGMIDGRDIGAWCLTEPDCGSDASALSCQVEKNNGSYIINGTKTFITNANEASLFTVFARLNNQPGSKGIICLVVDRHSPGITINPLKGKMGIRASSTAEIDFNNTKVPAFNILGQEEDGFKIAMQILDSSRIIIASQAVGIAQGALEKALSYSQQRQTFNRPLAQHQAIQFMLADCATKIEAARLLTRRAALLKDQNLPHTIESAMAKLFASETAHFVTDKALQIHGGYGFFKDNPVERYYRDAKITEIYEGSSEIQRLVIARNILKLYQI